VSHPEGTPALAAHLDLIEFFRESGDEWARWMMDSYRPEAQTDYRALLYGVKDLATAETVFVSKEMCAIIEKAARELPDVPLQEENLMWRRAFILFERPIVHERNFVEADGEGVATTSAIYFTHESKTITLAEEFVEGKLSGEKKSGVIHVTMTDSAQIDILREVFGISTSLIPFDYSAWAYGKKWKTTQDSGEWGKSVYEGLAQQRKLLLAVNLIAAQYIASVRQSRGPRQQRRRAERMGLVPEYGDITYVTLRRIRQRQGDGDGKSAGYSHRFIVRGFWRHQWYPSRGEHHLKWIDPYIKGDESLPLVIKDRVHKLVR